TDPLARLSRLNARTDVRRERRDLSAEEAVCLVNAALTSERHYRGLTGEDRHFVYAVALQTGFRAAELASLQPSSFDLSAAPPTATVEAGYTKNGQKAVQPL